MKILIVDDSAFFRHRLSDLVSLASDMQIVGYAVNGRDAVHKTHELKPDLITMDVQMPVVDGITAVRQIMRECPTRILMLSVLTHEGASETLEALEAGAVDFLPKELISWESVRSKERVAAKFLERVRAVGSSRLGARWRRTTQFNDRGGMAPFRREDESLRQPPKLLVIGASTGGPVALQIILSHLPKGFPLPILAAVHMPGSFTTAYAERLNTTCSIDIKEASDHQPLIPGQALIAPGGKQMRVDKGASGLQVRILEARQQDVYHPSVDQLFSSAARVLGNRVLGLVLTGMGADGLRGGRDLKSAGAALWSQDEKSCIVYGMPQAIERAGLADRVLPVEEMGQQLLKQL
jgi:two-component system chemotaxis response regulator CheB